MYHFCAPCELDVLLSSCFWRCVWSHESIHENDESSNLNCDGFIIFSADAMAFQVLDDVAVAEALRPLLQRLEVADSEAARESWLSLEKAAWLLRDFGRSHEIQKLMVAAGELLLPKADTLIDEHLRRLQQFRQDPLSTSTQLTSSRFCEILSQFGQWKEKLEEFAEKSQLRFEEDCTRTLEAAKDGNLAELWARRLVSSVQVEVIIDQHCPSSRFAALCASTWLRGSLPLLPRLLLKLFLLVKDSSEPKKLLLKLRAALDHCDEADALLQLRDAVVSASSLMLQMAWDFSDAAAVTWLSDALVVIHEVCELLLPELPATSLAAQLAAGMAAAPAMERLAEALALAVHQEVRSPHRGAMFQCAVNNILVTYYRYGGSLELRMKPQVKTQGCC